MKQIKLTDGTIIDFTDRITIDYGNMSELHPEVCEDDYMPFKGDYSRMVRCNHFIGRMEELIGMDVWDAYYWVSTAFVEHKELWEIFKEQFKVWKDFIGETPESSSQRDGANPEYIRRGPKSELL